MLNAPTKIFDSCGVIDETDSENPVNIPYGSKYDGWDNVIKFFNWYGIPEMSGFGLIIINDKNTQNYNANENLECFNNAKKMG